ncbi:MAG TPA: hypothetical protein VF294_03610, partial [Polyangiaceae bacterium]
ASAGAAATSAGAGIPAGSGGAGGVGGGSALGAGVALAAGGGVAEACVVLAPASGGGLLHAAKASEVTAANGARDDRTSGVRRRMAGGIFHQANGPRNPQETAQRPSLSARRARRLVYPRAA